ncbi:SpoIIAA family protein [Stratiformator vulcanicus]|uniref:STAS/SEC14 domain-containing protein n=1 Tax=Stratiformator vulcanicus TaxID=2527980 RepID=A0A517R0B4_9PLAN|nr:STAS/SEC14 domain-containing protein [Stratiformator vulcanicus]QDT37273.1 hypothetical protein Pan189_16460 [Stratiformator vulcanicus]
MTDAIEVKTADDLVEVHATGHLTHQMYVEMVGRIDEVIKANDKIRVLFVMHDFKGWTAGALWDDIKFDMAHWKDIKRLAIVGESKWEEGMAVFCKPFTAAKLKYFDHTKLDDAREWIVSDD